MYKLCVVGHPIKHSKSPWIHQQFAKQVGIKIEYTKLDVPLGHFNETIMQLRQQGFTGLNVTVPYKQEAFELATELSLTAEVAGAVNTLHFRSENIIYGDNTDGFGLVKDITKNLNYALNDKRILILGAGGAVRGILVPLLQQSPKEIMICNRTIGKAIQLVNDFSRYGSLQACDYQGLDDQCFDLIIDATSCMNIAEFLPNSLCLSENHLCYDLKYKAEDTPFLNWAKAQGATNYVDGIGMLIEQAAISFMLWTGKQPDTQSVLAKSQKLKSSA